MPDILTLETLQKITGTIAAGSPQARNAQSFLLALNRCGYDLGLNQPHRVAYLLGQVLLENGAFRYDREIWGPTGAQARYDTRTDLGNTPERDGDGYRFRGRTGMQITGRANYRAFTAWVRRLDPTAPDFEADPDAVNLDPWEGLGPLWYWSERGLNPLADRGDIRAVTRRINGGYNHLSERKRWTLRAQLVLLGYGTTDLRAFQRAAGLVVDGIPGPKSHAALHAALLALPPIAPPKPKPTTETTGIRAFLAQFLPWLAD
ncbi:glycoside hydrolase family 19 protein [Phaeobacter gallaeciensis]|uniref:glycoside hydrolase family 19 protein n=1 Tax=Phaeobacter gallaeciensis TaxID=60890 RepID=UPI00237F8E3C|nr:glycoside hydrolase family 19 protein [Phaeobacter gallaeciensis]MDE4193542.1 glycoside hydrolase family 19 protein [Phaeobacter gallaeciensis]MDE4201840.1 glycoside hydrolase family 19 protein [Phaeobacter gallaeciensis]MDE4205989.1 glycoside hydrolase family 19 protein [Phaeobacter gallaeciensis]MDE4210133.1 glycoside hydrolase family 19 protein [Phaeobacter gallaeciensis]MDE4218501.1 glycoside hydrolase family 19 protein [Phaeobacter gallaeciensis]